MFSRYLICPRAICRTLRRTLDAARVCCFKLNLAWQKSAPARVSNLILNRENLAKQNLFLDILFKYLSKEKFFEGGM